MTDTLRRLLFITLAVPYGIFWVIVLFTVAGTWCVCSAVGWIFTGNADAEKMDAWGGRVIGAYEGLAKRILP